MPSPSTDRMPSRSSRPSTSTPPSSRTRSRSSCPPSRSSSPRTRPADDAAAQAAFPQVRAYYERIEPVAEALGDLDPRIDYREVDAVADGLDWTGFHRIEKDLWVPADGRAERRRRDARLAGLGAVDRRGARGVRRPADRRRRRSSTTTCTPPTSRPRSTRRASPASRTARSPCSTRSRPARSPVRRTGGRAPTSGTSPPTSKARRWRSRSCATSPQSKGDDGAALVDEIDSRLRRPRGRARRARLARPTGFVNYSELTDDDKREFTDLINALAEPLSQLTVTVLE